MPSSLILSINNIPQKFSETDIYDAVVKKDICKVASIIIKTGKVKNSAIIMVDYWYKGTRHIRDNLLKGEPIPFIVGLHHMLLAVQHKPESGISSKVQPLYGEPDEFGRDILRTPKQSTLRVDAPEFVPQRSLKIAPALSDTQKRDNDFAAQTFIAQCENEHYSKPTKSPKGKLISSVVPSSKSTTFDDKDELCNKMKSISSEKAPKNIQKKETNNFAAAALKRKVKFIVPENIK